MPARLETPQQHKRNSLVVAEWKMPKSHYLGPKRTENTIGLITFNILCGPVNKIKQIHNENNIILEVLDICFTICYKMLNKSSTFEK